MNQRDIHPGFIYKGEGLFNVRKLLTIYHEVFAKRINTRALYKDLRDFQKNECSLEEFADWAKELVPIASEYHQEMQQFLEVDHFSSQGWRIVFNPKLKVWVATRKEDTFTEISSANFDEVMRYCSLFEKKQLAV